MAIQPLCCVPHVGLRTPASPITRFDHGLRVLVQDLIDTMCANQGVGLAAPQIGRGVRVFVASPTGTRDDAVAVVNPVLEHGRGKDGIVEGCLSVPDAWGPVPRWASVTMRGSDPSGRPIQISAKGLLAIILQHEIDHLDGRLFIDRVSPDAVRTSR